VVSVEVPPLRKRREDIPQLARIFLTELGQDSFNVPSAIMEQLKDHDWPGNVRELRNVVERGMSLTTSVIMQAGRREDEKDDRSDATAHQEAEDSTSRISDQMMDLPFKEAKSQLVEAFEREYLTQLLDRHHGNISRAAAEAGIDRNYIHRLVKKYNIDVTRG
jgi:two-component system nitrogen regulation response regulator GlnG